MSEMEVFFNNTLKNHTFIRSKHLAIEYMEEIMKVPNDCRHIHSEDIRALRHSIIIKFSKIMRKAVKDNRVKKHNSHIYKVIDK